MVEITKEYEVHYNAKLLDRLGDGKDGLVLATAERHAVKFFHDELLFHRELRAYQILRRRDIQTLNGFQIPKLIRSDESFRAIEMTIVQPPFLLDFASAYTLQEYAHFGFSQEVLDEREAHWAEIFEDKWPIARELAMRSRARPA